MTDPLSASGRGTPQPPGRAPASLRAASRQRDSAGPGDTPGTPDVPPALLSGAPPARPSALSACAPPARRPARGGNMTEERLVSPLADADARVIESTLRPKRLN